MVRTTIRDACALTLALLLALPVAAGDPADNADDGRGGSGGGEPCHIVYVDDEPPHVDPHPECINVPPVGP